MHFIWNVWLGGLKLPFTSQLRRENRLREVKIEIESD